MSIRGFGVLIFEPVARPAWAICFEMSETIAITNLATAMRYDPSDAGNGDARRIVRQIRQREQPPLVAGSEASYTFRLTVPVQLHLFHLFWADASRAPAVSGLNNREWRGEASHVIAPPSREPHPSWPIAGAGQGGVAGPAVSCSQAGPISAALRRHQVGVCIWNVRADAAAVGRLVLTQQRDHLA
jgi:hypothetical protein